MRPGIDMVGGTSLVYEIERPSGTPMAGEGSLAEQVATALKRRVDPNGVLNLIWRPQGDTRLEIQLPFSGDRAKTSEAQNAFVAAQTTLETFIVRPQLVVRTIETAEGEAREAELNRLAMGSESRLADYSAAASAYDAVKAARESGTIVAQSDAEAAYEAAKSTLGRTNLTIETISSALQATPEVRERRFADLAELNAGFPARTKALADYVAAYDAYEAVRSEIADTATLKRLLQGSGVLEFHILPFRQQNGDLQLTIPAPDYDAMVTRLDTTGPRPRADDQYRWFEVEPDATISWPTEVGPDGKNYVLAYNTDERSLDDRDGDWSLSRATRAQDDSGFQAVGFQLDPLGASLFGDISGQNVGLPLAIILDDQVISAPGLNSRITSNGIITGGKSGFSAIEQNYLVSTLNAGALPARLSEEPISERTIGPQLGADNLRRGFAACILGLVIVGVFLIGYYYLSGTVAFTAVLLNMLIILAAMAALQATFTLPSIAGIILSLGMSVDANVLIYERLREEQVRGLSIRMALRNAYDRAFSAILDSNITTGITALVLYVFGSEEVKGFGLTLLIGVGASLFTALYVTKTIFGLMIDKAGVTDLKSLPRTFPRWNAMLTPKTDWMKWSGVIGGISSLVIAVGCALFGWYFQQGRMLDIEFAGGTTAQFTLNEPMTTAEVRELLESDDIEDVLADVQVVNIEPPAGGVRDTVYEAVVSEQDKAAVTAAVVERMGDRLSVRQPSSFTGSDLPFEQAQGQHVFPIEPGMTEIAGLQVDPDKIAQTAGGVAVVLTELSPTLEPTELSNRITQQRLKGQYEAEGLRGTVIVEVETFPTQDAAIIYIANDRFTYDSANDEVAQLWESELAGPTWQVVVDAVADPDELERVTNIGGAVAAEFQRNAAIAVILSVLAIMAYIWIRFGDLKYSTAAVIALVHDTLFCIAMLGYAHLLAETFFGNFLLIDPFRLNLTMVAAILTVMGFSMNDTVVVFDRIRENRGKYGLLTNKVINDSINQTLSRTLLTGGTTIVTILAMYVFGGPSIHGFTYVMFLGIVAGTYSSIAIASPLLLFGKQEAQVAPSDSNPSPFAPTSV